MSITKLKSDKYQRIHNFVNEQIEWRDKQNELSPHTPSKYWQDFNRITGYVRRLQDVDLEHIRYHTWHINSDIYFTYFFYPHHIPKVIETYLGLSQSLDGFKPYESETGLGFDTEYGKLSMDLLRYMRALSDLYTHDRIWREGKMNVFEIGGGYGHLARVFLSFNPRTTYVICDLEETLFFQAVYLTNELGAEKVQFLTGNEAEDFKLAEGTVYLVPQSHLHSLEKYNFDVVLNQQSMQEMTKDQVDNYCQLIKQTCNYFYSSNIDQHIDSIVERTGIMKGVNNYLASKFPVEWSSQSSIPQSAETVQPEQRGKIKHWLRHLFSPATVTTAPAVADSGTDYGDYRVHRMIFKVK